MKNIALILITFITSINIASADTLDHYLSPKFGREVRLGDETEGRDFTLLSSSFDFEEGNLSASQLNNKIKAITFYMATNHNHINGIKIEYTNNDSESIGSTNGNKNRKTLNDDEYINELKIFAKENESNHNCRTGGARVTKVRFKTTEDETLWYGRDRGFDCDRSKAKSNHILIGLYGTFENGKVLSLAPIWQQDADLVYVETFINPEANHLLETINAPTVHDININDADNEMVSRVEFSHSVEEGVSNTWSNTNEVSRTIGMTLGLEVSYGDITAATELSSEVSSLDSQTVGQEDSIFETRELSFSKEITVSPRSVQISYMTFMNSEISQEYTAIFKDQNACDDLSDPTCTEIEFVGTLTASEHMDTFYVNKLAGTFNDDGLLILDPTLSDFEKDLVEAKLNRFNYEYEYADSNE